MTVSAVNGVDVGFTDWGGEFYDAIAAVGWLDIYYRWDFESAERRFREIIKLQPNHEWGHSGLSDAFGMMDRSEEALEILLEGIVLNPVFALHQNNLIRGYTNVNDFRALLILD